MTKTPIWLVSLDIVSRGNRIRERLAVKTVWGAKIIRILFYFWDIVIGVPKMLFLILKINKCNCKRKDKLAIVAIAKNESDYIREWVAYHKVIGVERIYLYDNDSTDGTKEEIQDFIDNGFVVYNVIHGQCRQMDAYNDALQTFGSKCIYMAYIDCDEFLTPVDKDIKIGECLDKFFSSYPQAGALAVNWCMFGSSNLEKKPNGMLIDNFLWRAKIGRQGTDVVKSIIRPSKTLFFDNPHYAVFRFGYAAYDIYGKYVENFVNVIPEYKGLKINHYFTKSKQQWIKRRSIGKADLGGADKRSLQEFHNHDNNDVLDKSSLVFSRETKNIMFGNNVK